MFIRNGHPSAIIRVIRDIRGSISQIGDSGSLAKFLDGNIPSPA